MLMKLFKVVTFGKKTTGWVWTDYPRKDRDDIVSKSTILSYGDKNYKVSIEYVKDTGE